ncbi:MAG: putative lipid II flippase FtsW [Patescibacteria group bacterium]
MHGRGHQPDYILIALIAILVLFGLVMLSSAGAPISYQKFGNSYYYFTHQIITGLIPGLILFFFFSNYYYRKLREIAMPLLFISIILLILVFIPGLRTEYGTAHSWLNIFGFSVQPSEIVKITFLIYLASWLEQRGEHKIKDLHSGFIPFLTVLGVISLLMILQPDIGTLSVMIAMSLVVYFMAGGSTWHLLSLSGVGLMAFAVLVKISPYRLARFTAFLHPEKDPQGVAYHINQALIAVGSGGWLGLGLGHSRQKFAYLPEVTGDSIFAVIAEEIGFIFTVLVIILFLFLAWRGIKLAQAAPDKFAKLLVIGIVSWFIIQSFVNIGSVLGILPMTGLPLPFVSSGGTALMTCLAAAGILVNISRFCKID